MTAAESCDVIVLGGGTPSSIAKTAAVAVCVEAKKSPSQG
jgi:hypothetical protein